MVARLVGGGKEFPWRSTKNDGHFWLLCWHLWKEKKQAGNFRRPHMNNFSDLYHVIPLTPKIQHVL